jgi:hypothetical protein
VEPPGERIPDLPTFVEENLNYRYQYRFWREGKAKGCVTTSSGPVENPQMSIISKPEVSAWEVPPSELEWAFRHTASYAVSVLFLLGSILFVIGCLYELYIDDMDSSHKRNLIRGPFFIGTVAFVMGSYAGVLEILNVGNFEKTGKLVFWKNYPDGKIPPDAFWCYWCFFVGSIIFMIPPLVEAFHDVRIKVEENDNLSEMFVSIPYAVGSVFFVIAGHLEMKQNGGYFRICRSDKKYANIADNEKGIEIGHGEKEEEEEEEEKFDFLSWNLAIQNWVGSILFLIGGISACYYMNDDSYYGTKIPFLIGSMLFLVSSIIGIWLWKDEKFGLGRAAALTRFAPIDHVERPHGDRREVKWLDAVCVVLSIFGLTASVVDVCFASTNGWSINHYDDDENDRLNTWYRLLDAIVILLLLMGITVLASTIYRVPDRPEFSGLIKYLRLIVILLSFTAWVGFDN